MKLLFLLSVSSTIQTANGENRRYVKKREKKLFNPRATPFNIWQYLWKHPQNVLRLTRISALGNWYFLTNFSPKNWAKKGCYENVRKIESGNISFPISHQRAKLRKRVLRSPIRSAQKTRSKYIILTLSARSEDFAKLANFLEKKANILKNYFEIFVKNRNFRQKLKFSSKIEIIVKNWNFRQKLRFSSIIEIFIKNQNIF